MRDFRIISEQIHILGQGIEERLQWGKIQDWRYSQFKDLSVHVEEKVQVRISHMTLIRILQNGEFRRSPQKATLDALARFLDYEDWEDFSKSHPVIPSNQEAEFLQDDPDKGDRRREQENQMESLLSPASGHLETGLRKYTKVLVALFMVGALAFASAKISIMAFSEPEREVSFACVNPWGEYYHRFIFKYKVPGKGYKLRIRPLSWLQVHDIRTEKSYTELNPEDSVYLNKAKLYPGEYSAELIKDGSVLKHIPLSIGTTGWDAIIQAKPKLKNQTKIIQLLEEPVVSYKGNISLPDSLENELMDMLLDHRVETNFFKTVESGIDANHLTLKIALKNTTRTPWNYCNFARVCLLTTNGMVEMPLLEDKCIEAGFFILGDYKASFRNQQILSQFVFDEPTSDTIKIEISGMKGRFFRNSTLLEEVSYTEKLGTLSTVRVKFEGVGEIDFFSILDYNTALVSIP